jgi:hypothetical protein
MVVNRTVDEILALEARKKSAKTLSDYMRLAQRAFKLKRAFMAELAEVYSLQPTGTPLLS